MLEGGEDGEEAAAVGRLMRMGVWLYVLVLDPSLALVCEVCWLVLRWHWGLDEKQDYTRRL